MDKSKENLKIPVDTVPEDVDIVQYFKELLSKEEFAGFISPERNKIVRYIIYAYDLESSCVKNNSHDLKKRKESAAERAGFKRSRTGSFPEIVHEIMNMKNSDVNKMICCYLRYFVHNNTWKLIVVNEQIMSEYITLLLEPVAQKDDKKTLEAANIKSKLREECKAIASDIKSLYKDLYGDNDDLKEEIIKPVRPETMGGVYEW
jgi:hypothetical protein